MFELVIYQYPSRGAYAAPDDIIGLPGSGFIMYFFIRLAGNTESYLKGETMSRIVGSCGIVCTECPAFIAYRTNDQALREKTSEEWSEMYGAPIKAADINCVGCLATEGVQISHCAECDIRNDNCHWN